MYKLREIKMILSRIDGFKSPKYKLEQYITPFDLSANILNLISSIHNDIEGKKVLDLCGGPGMLGINSLFYGPESVTNIDIDTQALEICKSNIEKIKEYIEVELICSDEDSKISKALREETPGDHDKRSTRSEEENSSDSETQNNSESEHFESQTGNSDTEDIEDSKIIDYRIIKGDINELQLNEKFDTCLLNPPFGMRIKGIDIKAIEFGLSHAKVVYVLHSNKTRDFYMKKFENIEIVAEMKYDLPTSYDFHKKKNVTIDVDLYRIVSVKK